MGQTAVDGNGQQQHVLFFGGKRIRAELANTQPVLSSSAFVSQKQGTDRITDVAFGAWSLFPLPIFLSTPYSPSVIWSWLGNASFTARSMDHIIWAVFFHSTVVVVVVTKSARTDNAAAKVQIPAVAPHSALSRPPLIPGSSSLESGWTSKNHFAVRVAKSRPR